MRKVGIEVNVRNRERRGKKGLSEKEERRLREWKQTIIIMMSEGEETCD